MKTYGTIWDYSVFSAAKAEFDSGQMYNTRFKPCTNLDTLSPEFENMDGPNPVLVTYPHVSVYPPLCNTYIYN